MLKLKFLIFSKTCRSLVLYITFIVRKQHSKFQSEISTDYIVITKWENLTMPLPKYKVSGIYKPQICRKLAARLRLIFAARLPQTRFSYANFFSGALFWPTMCAARMLRTVVAHCSGTQYAPQVCSAQLRRTVLAHNVRRKYAAHSSRALFWHTMCAASLQRTVIAHYSCVPQVCGAQLPCTALFCPTPSPTPPLVYHPYRHIFF